MVSARVVLIGCNLILFKNKHKFKIYRFTHKKTKFKSQKLRTLPMKSVTGHLTCLKLKGIQVRLILE